jgi:4-carboxymuconolactone decarboxylase
MDEERQSLVRLSAALATGDQESIEQAARVAHGTARPVAVEECLLQSYLFLGFPAALTALMAWREISGAPPAPEPASGADDLARWIERGGEVCRIVYGRAYEKLRGNVRRVHPAMDRWMIQEGYGRVLGRPGLDLATRELCIVAILAATGWESQLHSHLRGALHAGCLPDAVEAALEEGLARSPDDDWPARARHLWERVRVRRAHPSG